jgi:hypothetical protein
MLKIGNLRFYVSHDINGVCKTKMLLKMLLLKNSSKKIISCEKKTLVVCQELYVWVEPF